jgi:hypothetical protein
MRIAIVSLIAFGALLAGCSSKVTTPGKTASTGKYSEDLSVWRQKETTADTTKQKHPVETTTTKDRSTQYVEPKFAVNESLDAVLDSINRINLENGLVDGFTIQVYSGVKREEALNVKKHLAGSLPDLESEVQYVQPNFRVRAGKYYDRLQAQKDYTSIKRYFPNAIVLPERIPIKSDN